MADIFISYASADRDRAKALADALAARGSSVWWDRVIPPGRVFDEVIEEALDAAKCVVVLWSTASVASSWVRTEAAEAMRRKILVPALIEHVKIPLEFRRLQAADLSQWPDAASDVQFAEFSRSVDGLVRGDNEWQIDSRVAIPGSAVTRRPGREPAVHEAARRGTPRPMSRAVLAWLGGVVTIALVAGYVVYDGVERQLAGERHARERAERTASEEAQRQADQSRRNAVETAARSQTPATEPRPHAETSRLAAQAPARAAASEPLDIHGSWRDTTWGHRALIVQQGNTYQYTAWGTSCRGNFQSSGVGSIRGTHVESTYRSNTPSEGRCSGTVSPDGTRINSKCVDSVCGRFVETGIRQ